MIINAIRNKNKDKEGINNISPQSHSLISQ